MKILKNTIICFFVLTFAFFHASPLLLHANSSRVESDHLALWFSSPTQEQATSMTFHYEFDEDIEVACFFLHISFPRNTFLLEDDDTSFLHTDFLPYLRINGERIDENNTIHGRLTKHYLTLSNYTRLPRQNYLQLTLTEEFGLMFKESGLIPFHINLGMAYDNDTDQQKINLSQRYQVRVFEHLP